MALLGLAAARADAGPLLRYLGAGILAVAVVVGAGVWLGHRLDPTWTQRRAPLKRALPFHLPPLAGSARWSRAVAGRPSILELRFPGCGADDSDVTSHVAALAASVRARGGREPGWVTLLVGGLPASDAPAVMPARYVAPLDPARLADVAAQMGLADSARAAEDGLLDARHWMFAVDAAGWVRGAADVTDAGGADDGWSVLQNALLGASAAPLAAPSTVAPDSPAAEPARRLPDFRAVDQDGRPFAAAELAGHPAVVDFIFTRCTGACPMLTARLAALRRLVPAPDARFVSFSVDPANDTPDVLRAYAARWGAPDPRWRLLAADAGTVRAVARALGESVVQPEGGPILHSDHFTLIDRFGVVQTRVASGDLASLRALAAALVAAPGTSDGLGASGAPAAGARLFSSLGCGGCHGDARLAPPLAGVAGRPVRLTGGRAVAADDRYLRQSITAPAADLVDGFGPTMPSYGGLLTNGELTALVDYVKALPR